MILKTVVVSIAKEWKSTHPNNTSYKLWKWLKHQYTEGNVTMMKWSVIMNIEKMSLLNHKNIDQYRSNYHDLAHQIDDLKITLKDALMLKVLNNLSSRYNQFMAVLMSDICNKSDDINPEYIWKALEQEEKQAAVKSKQQANTATTGKNAKKGNNHGSDGKPKVCKGCRIPHKTGPGVVCHDKDKTCEECGATGHRKKYHNRWLEANNKKPKDDQSDSNSGGGGGSGGGKATKNVTCCITTSYALKPASDSNADIKFDVSDRLIHQQAVGQ